jgi:hypothetical protein
MKLTTHLLAVSTPLMIVLLSTKDGLAGVKRRPLVDLSCFSDCVVDRHFPTETVRKQSTRPTNAEPKFTSCAGYRPAMLVDDDLVSLSRFKRPLTTDVFSERNIGWDWPSTFPNQSGPFERSFKQAPLRQATIYYIVGYNSFDFLNSLA